MTFAIVLLFLAATGAGAAVLYALGLWRHREAIERGALSFALGFAVLGWILFWIGTAGLLRMEVLWPTFVVLTTGNVLHRVPPAPLEPGAQPSMTVWVLIGLAALAAVFDVFEAVSPPIDADSLAYHFELPRRFVEAGDVGFVPRAFSGAIPLGVHMTYAAALALGGETGMTAWSALSGWMAAVLVFAFTRRWLSVAWALALAVLYQTLPAMVFGAGSGQVEARLAMFVLVAMIGLSECWRNDRLAPAVLVGLGAGAYAAGKYTGLLFVLAATIAITICGREFWLRRVAAFALAAAITGGQWYGWNMLHTGDPVFPMLFALFDAAGFANHDYWNAVHDVEFRTYIASKGAVVDSAYWWISFPFVATLIPPSEIESGRVGFGPFFLLVCPFALYGAWRRRDQLLRSTLFPTAVLVLAYYLFWMQFGGVPKVRHVLPLIPPLMICLAIAALNGAGVRVRGPMFLAASLSLVINFGAYTLFSLPYLKFQLTGQTRDAFLRNNLRGYPAAQAVNALPGVTRVYVWDRQLQYYINAPTFFAAPYTQVMIDGRVGRVEPVRFHQQLRTQDISHVVMTVSLAAPVPRTVQTAIPALAALGCLAHARSVKYRHFMSRTLKGFKASVGKIDIWRVLPNCGTGSNQTTEGRDGSRRRIGSVWPGYHHPS